MQLIYDKSQRCGSRERIQKKVRSCTRIFVAPFYQKYSVALIELSSGMRMMGKRVKPGLNSAE